MSSVQIIPQYNFEGVYNQEQEICDELSWKDHISLELMCVQQQIHELKKELQELLDMETDLESACSF
uniref:Uncharacterized protein n=1 Tax=Marseillevirus sp. TaxID=2809551 RepID=A0AA96J2X0_9VIRU|nr:hypothetical protein MarFTMF_059 [Marseillevirus sp.]